MSARHIIRAHRGIAADLSFMGTLPSGSTLTRATVGTYHDSSGVLQSAAIDAARFSYDPTLLTLRGMLVEPQRSNFFTNPRWEGGVNGTPGTAPTGMTLTSTAGLLTRTLTFGTEDGMPTMSVQYAGNSNSAGAKQLVIGGTQEIPTAAGDTWTYSQYTSMPAGSALGWTSRRMASTANNAAGAGVSTFGTLEIAPTNAATRTQRFVLTAQIALATTTAAFVQPKLIMTPSVTSGMDMTFKIGGLQAELGAFATSLILPTVGSPAVSTRAADLLTVAAPSGNYIVDAYGGTNDPNGARYSSFARFDNGSWAFAWPDLAIAAGERHLQRIVLRRLW